MFYCNDCAKEKGYPETLTKSEGLCELCGKHAICNDMPSSYLPKPEIFQPESLVPKKIYPIIDVPADGKPKWYGGACCMMFVYSKNHGNFILRGFSDEAEKYLKKHYTHYFYYISMWCDGKSRGYWHFWKNGVTILEPNRRLKRDKRYKYVIHKSFNGGYYNDLSELKQEKPIELKFKRLPKQWIPEFDQL